MKHIFTIFLSLIVFFTFSQEQSKDSILQEKKPRTRYIFNLDKTIYFDKNWDTTTNDKYKYYRTSKKSDLSYQGIQLVEITDHFNNGKTQMTGYVFHTDTSFPVGLWTYYDSKGYITQYRLYDYDAFIDEFPYIKKYVEIIDPIEIEYKHFHIRFHTKERLKSIGFRRADGKNIGLWRYYKKNGKYIKCDFKNGVAPTVIRVYNKDDQLIRKGYYSPKN